MFYRLISKIPVPKLWETEGSIGLNLLWLEPGRVGGTEEHAIELLRGLDASGQVDEEGEPFRLRLYANSYLLDAYPELADRWEVIKAPSLASNFAVEKLSLEIALGLRIVLENTWLAWRSRNDRMVHHLGGTIPLVRIAPAVVTIHDLQPMEYPENFSRLKRAWLHWMLSHAVSNAKQIVCPSAFTADAINRLFPTNTAEIHVVGHGSSAPSQPPVEATTAKYDRFVLYPAIAYGHKRHIDLVEALAVLRRLGNYDDVSVVFTGRAGPQTPHLCKRVDELGLGSRVHFLGRVPRHELEALYRDAVALVFPSEYEGFGNPVLEAMARGCVVITSDAGASPEVAAAAGLIVPVGDVQGYAKAIDSILSDESHRIELQTKGLERAAQFASPITAAQLAAVYRSQGPRRGR